MPLQQFSAAYIDERFRIKIGFDTNLLMYLLDNSYPSLNLAVTEFNKYPEFIDLITNRYSIFELYEKRKEAHFIKCAESLGLFEKINSDKFYLNDVVRYQRFFSIVFSKRIWGKRLHRKIFTELEKHLSVGQFGGEGLFFENRQTIINSVNDDIPKIQSQFGIEISGTIHDNIWDPTFELILNSRISREDSLIATAFIQPDAVKSEKNLILLTNDGDFEFFYRQAQQRGIISPLFTKLGLHEPEISRITQLRTMSGHNINLRNTIISNFQSNILSYLKNAIIERNKNHFLGHTDSTILPKSKEMIGIKVTGLAQYHKNQNLLIIGNNLDFFYTIPHNILEFKTSDSKSIDFPLRVDHKKVTYKHIPLDANDPDKIHENQIFSALKQHDNLVFVHPDI